MGKDKNGNHTIYKELMLVVFGAVLGIFCAALWQWLWQGHIDKKEQKEIATILRLNVLHEMNLTVITKTALLSMSNDNNDMKIFPASFDVQHDSSLFPVLSQSIMKLDPEIIVESLKYDFALRQCRHMRDITRDLLKTDGGNRLNTNNPAWALYFLGMDILTNNTVKLIKAIDNHYPDIRKGDI